MCWYVRDDSDEVQEYGRPDDDDKIKGLDATGEGLPCLGGEDLLDVFGDLDVAREPSVEAMMSINKLQRALRRQGGFAGGR